MEEHTLFEIEMKLISQIQILMLRIRALIESRETKILTLNHMRPLTDLHASTSFIG